MGECLNDMSFEDLRGLEQDMDTALNVIRERKVLHYLPFLILLLARFFICPFLCSSFSGYS